MSDSAYKTLRKISIPYFFSLDVYSVKPGGLDPKHHHNFEMVYVIKGNSTTHKLHHVYIYPKGKIHEMINDTNNELILACLTIPSEGKIVYI